MFNLGVQAEKIHRKPYIPMLKENNVRTGFFEHGDFISFVLPCQITFSRLLRSRTIPAGAVARF
jgi:hypothetical protein